MAELIRFLLLNVTLTMIGLSLAVSSHARRAGFPLVLHLFTINVLLNFRYRLPSSKCDGVRLEVMNVWPALGDARDIFRDESEKGSLREAKNRKSV